jgi:CDP-diacylglycerol--glycerol-3-phosphate 3-phosphatidyltransferase
MRSIACKDSVINLPTSFTLVRLIFSPILVPPLIVLLVPSTAWSDHLIVAGTFVFLGMTDFIDGFLARRTKQETDFGRQLDPLADKILILSALLPLVALYRVSVWLALLILIREFFVLSLREMAVARGFSLPVIHLGKIKMAVQVLYLMLAMLLPTGVELEQAISLMILMNIMQLATVVVTIWSGIRYFRLFFRLLSS